MARRFLTFVSVLALAGCGGSDGSSGGSVIVTPAPAPTPTPTPAPTPTPSPTPTPTPTATAYKTFAQLTGDQTFNSACASFILDQSPPAVAPTSPFGQGLTFRYADATQTYSISGDGVSSSFGPADVDPSAAPGGAYHAYVKTVGGNTERFIIAQPTINGSALEYLRSIQLIAASTSGPRSYSCIIGVPTLPSDVPATTQVTFTRTQIDGSGYLDNDIYRLNGSTVTLSVNLTTGTVDTTIHLVGQKFMPGNTFGPDIDLGTFHSAADINATRTSYEGQFDSGDGVGQFSYLGGWFFGPQGREAGYAFELRRTDPTTGRLLSVVGTVTAAR